MTDKPFVAKNSVLIQGSNTQLSQNSLVVGNSSVNSSVNSTAVFFGNSTVNATINTTSIQLVNSTASINVSPIGLSTGATVVNSSAVVAGIFVANSLGGFVGANLQFSATGVLIGNSTVNTAFTVSDWKLANSTASVNVTPIGILTGIVVVNSTQLAVGTNLIANATTLAVGNSTVYQRQTATLLTIVGTVGIANVNQNGISVGISSVNSTVVAVGANVYANATAIYADTSKMDSTSVFVGNSTVNTNHTKDGLQVANSTSSANVSAGGFVAGIVTINTTAASVGANVVVSATNVKVGNSTANSTLSSTIINVANSLGQVNVSPIDIKVGAATINTIAFNVGNAIVNATSIVIGNSTVYHLHSATELSISDTNATTNLSSYGIIAGSVVVNTSIVKVGANVYQDAAGFVAGSSIFNGTGFSVGNSSVNAFANSTLLKIASGGVTANITASDIKVGITVVNTTAIAHGNTILNGASVVIGNSSVNTTVNSTTFTGTSYVANNASYLNGQAGAYYANLNNSTGTVPSGGLNPATSYTTNVLSACSYLYSYGHVYAVGDVYSSYSDGRIKIDVKRIEDPLEKVLKFSVVSYYQNSALAKEIGLPENNKRQLGLIAQEVKEVFPEVVDLASFDRDALGNSRSGEDYMTISYARLVPVLIGAIQELNNKVEKLEKEMILIKGY